MDLRILINIRNVIFISKTKNITPLDIYNKRAAKYDSQTKTMESFVSKEKQVFHFLKGKILEVGTGTGLNLKYYNSSAEVYAIDWSPNMVRLAQRKVKELNLNNIVEIKVADVQELEEIYRSQFFDFVTARCVFCSVPNPVKGLKQIAKILKPNGKLIQLEHGLSKLSIINLGLNSLDPIVSKRFGLHINRDHVENLKQAGFQILYQKFLEPTKIFRLIISKLI